MTEPSAPGVRTELEGHVLWVTLDRPEKRNALDWDAFEQLDAAWRRIVEDPDVWLAVVTGAGDKAFCTGADLSTLPQQIAARRDAGERDAYPPVGFNEIFCPKPVIAAVNGDAVGGGLELALACDIRIAADHARFGLPEARLGGMPGAGGTQRLPRAVPPSVALDLMYTARLMPAVEAHSVHLVNRVVAPGELETVTREMVERILVQAPLGLRGVKTAALGGLDGPLDAGLALERTEADRIIASHDYRNAMDAFATGKAPEWEGR